MDCRCAAEAAFSPDANAVAGPLNTLSMSAGNLFRSSGCMPMPSYAPAKSWVLLTSFSWVNTWNVDQDHFMIDGEWLLLSERVSYMLTDDLELGGYIPFLARTGGCADSLIEGFHNTFDLGNARREGYPRNRSVVDIRSPAGRQTRWEGQQWGLSDISMFASWTLTRGGRLMPCIVLGGVATLPTGDEAQLLGSGEPVFGVSALLTKRIESSPWLLFLGTSASYSRDDEMAGIDIRRTQFAVLAGIAYEWNKRVSIILQNLSTSPIAENFHEFSKPSNELNLGLRVRAGSRGAWEISIQENLFYFNNSPDVGLHAGYRCVL